MTSGQRDLDQELKIRCRDYPGTKNNKEIVLAAEQGILASIEFQMSLLMFVALAGYLIAYRINQSAVVGIILAGIIVGPSLLGLVTYTEFVSS